MAPRKFQFSLTFSSLFRPLYYTALVASLVLFPASLYMEVRLTRRNSCTLKKDVTDFCYTTVSEYQITWHHLPEDRNLEVKLLLHTSVVKIRIRYVSEL
jgi:hypothetical protein